MAKWPNHFISGKPFQNGQMATMTHVPLREMIKRSFNLNGIFKEP